MLLTGNKSAGAIFGTFICRFDILTALSEINVPLQSVQNYMIFCLFAFKGILTVLNHRTELLVIDLKISK